MNQSTSIIEIKGIGEKTAALFQKLNIETVGDLLLHYPRTYVQFPVAKEVAEVTDGETAAVLGRVRKTPVVRRTRSMPVTVTTIGTDEAELELVWFRMPYIKSQLAPGNTYVFYGKVARKGSRLVMEQAAIYSGEAYAAMEQAFLPVYGLTGGISNNLVTKTVRSVLGREELFKEYLPREIRSRYKLCEYNYAIKEIHFPENMDTLIAARNRLVFDEFFLFILNMQYHKEKRIKEANEFELREDSFTDELIARLPYELTGAQKRALSEVKRDMRSPYVMQRLIQGDVGSGKTIIAFLAMADAAHIDYQSAIMAPTEVLARQHYETFQKLCEEFGLKIPVVLLTGSMTARQKRMAYEALQLYPNAMVVGTHALIQERAIYDNLALVITDEQHRFGVEQRSRLWRKYSRPPHILVMTATPIPRTLAMTVYGDLDVSVIDELPPGRKPVTTIHRYDNRRAELYESIRRQIEQGRQVYIVYPLIQESEKIDLKNLEEGFKQIREVFPEYTVCMVHGKMKPAEKDAEMQRFVGGEAQIMVATTVIEVGVNVPNATVMVIENAERFGLSQLHQLRGRVGRGADQSYCVLVTSHKLSEDTRKRIEIMTRTNDGFEISEADLQLRGPGDMEGTQQSGIAFDLRIANIAKDGQILQLARDIAGEVLDADPDLAKPENAVLPRRLEKLFRRKIDFSLIS